MTDLPSPSPATPPPTTPPTNEAEANAWPRRYRVRHRTDYTYGMTVSDAYSVACMLPRARPTQRIVERDLEVTPEPNEFDARRDVFGNHVTQVGVHRPHDGFTIVANSIVELDAPYRPSSSLSWEEVALLAARLTGRAAVAVGPYRALTAATTPTTERAALDELARSVFTPGRGIVDAAAALMSTIFEHWTFDPTATDWATPLDAVLHDRRGVCQDFAHLGIAAMRSVGLPASYVSGYIETDPPPGEEKSIGADASHAWCSVWIPDAAPPQTGSFDHASKMGAADEPTADQSDVVADVGGQHRWFDFDPTNDQFPPTRHVTVAWGRDYADVAPLRGVVIGPSSQQRLDVSVDVQRL
ncbi:MAG: transglutaminase family protein [Actinomycetota bacterium]